MTTILVVDDQAINLKLLASILGRTPGVEVQTEVSAKQALAQSETKAWDLVIADYMMPEMDGLTFIRALRDLPQQAQTPVLMVTASTEPAVKYALLNMGVVDFLPKPVDAAELTARARNLISLHQATVALQHHNQALRKGVQEMTLELADRERETLLVLGRAAESRDPQTGRHLARMASYSRLIAQALALDEEAVDLIYLAAPMHDVGKIGTPDHILLNPGKLSAEEWEEMKRHTVYGFEIMGSSTSPVLKMGASIALCHHEAWDGTGYPRGIKGDAIPMAARIVTVADVFDALTSERPYKRAWTVEDAVQELKALAGIRLDARCVAALLSRMGEVMEIMKSHADH
jgi:response regulator RpfG family c-di-GMP phosphodiesterase